MDGTNTSPDLHRIPGLFRRWELPQVLKLGMDYHLLAAGRCEDGSELVAVFERMPEEHH
jgi:hypothetical protein